MRQMRWVIVIVAVVTFAVGRCAKCQESPEQADPGHAAAGGPHASGHGEDLGAGNATSDLGNVASLASDLTIYTFVVFLLLLGILSWLAWPKISEALAEREKRIEGAIADAQAKHEQAKRLLAEHEAKLAGAAAEVRALLDEARRDAEATKSEIVAEARAAAKAEHDRAKRDVEVALDAATKHLAEVSANLAVELAGKAIRETIQPAKQQELVREALVKLAASAPSKN